jgi:membrane fusion protein, multidrug efflux system
VPGAPAVKQAEAKLESAERDLDQAELNLRYCEIIAEIDGVVTRRNVNPGNNVLAGQGLMAIRSLDEIWVDANFKETQQNRELIRWIWELFSREQGIIIADNPAVLDSGKARPS